MADFNITLPIILDHEGGYVLTNDVDDRGGKTYAGISSNSNPDWEGWKLVDEHNAAATPAVRRAVRNLYHDKYWYPICGDRISNQELATMIMSIAVLSGTGRAARMLQQVCGCVVDGVIGSQTIAAANALDPEVIMLRLFAFRAKRFRNICLKNRYQRKYFLGWIGRALDDLEAGL